VNPGGLATLTLNGSSIPTRTGDYTLNVSLVEGQNTFTLIATDSQNRSAQAAATMYLDSTPPVISIATPANNSSYGTARINVQGTFTETSIKHISVNGIAAVITGNTYEGLNVPLAAGANTITAIAQDIAGNIGTATITVNATPDNNGNLADPAQLQVSPNSGFTPLQATLQGAASVPGTLQQVLYDFDGDGIIDQTGSGLQSITHTYSNPGQYFPVVTVVTTGGRFSSINTLRVVVQMPLVQANPISVTDPVDVKALADGSLYVLSRNTATILQYNASGVLLRSLPGIGNTPTGFDVDGAGRVYVAIHTDNQVAKYVPITGSFALDPTFNQTGRIGRSDKASGSGNGEFNAPFDVAVTPDGGAIAVSDAGNHRIQRFAAADGSFLEAFGQLGSALGQFNTPKGLTYDATAFLYIVDSGNSRIVLAESSVAFPYSGTGVIGSTGSSGTSLGQFQGAVNLSTGDRGIYVADTGNNRIQIFDPLIPGKSSSSFIPRLAISSEAGLNHANSVTVLTDLLQEKVYVADTGNNRVTLITLPGISPDPVWNAMKQRLIAGDVQGALPYFSSLSADDYRTAFLSITTADLTSMIGQIGTITPVFIGSNAAEYRFDQTIDGIIVTFPIEFVLENGTWKISEF